MIPFQIKGNHLTDCMCTCICAPSCQDGFSLPVELMQGGFNHTLYAADFDLPLKAFKMRAVVGEDNLVMFHGWLTDPVVRLGCTSQLHLPSVILRSTRSAPFLHCLPGGDPAYEYGYNRRAAQRNEVQYHQITLQPPWDCS